MSFFSKPRTLSVYANPYCATDHKGRPAGAFPHKPNLVHGDSHVMHVGATRTAEQVRDPVMIAGFVVQEAEHDRSFDFRPEVFEVENDDHYHRAIRSRELIAADKEAWLEAGCNPQLYVDPKTALANEKQGAMHAQIAAYGEVAPELLDHWKEFHEPPAEAASADEPHEAQHIAPEDHQLAAPADDPTHATAHAVKE